jgi:hypothetical protein
VYRSEADNISNYTCAENNGTQVTPGWTVDLESIDVTGLSAGTTYYFNVFVRDTDARISPYTTTSADIQDNSNSIYIFPAGLYTGNLGGRSGADTLCQNARDTIFSGLPVSNVRGFLTISSSDQIINMTINYGIPADEIILSPFDIQIAGNWADLTDETIDTTLAAAGIVFTHWWTGSDGYGMWIDDSVTCNGFTNGTDSYEGKVGAHDETDKGWLKKTNSSCDHVMPLLCAGW